MRQKVKGAIRTTASMFLYAVMFPWQVGAECLLCICCVPVAHVDACSLLFTHCAAHCVYGKADMTATSIN